MVTQFLQRIGPSETAMLDWLLPRIDDDILAEIATCDAPWNVAENFEALKVIQDTRQIPEPLDWVPLEVLRLSRWGYPWIQHAADATAEDVRRYHIKHVFCCAILLRASTDYDRYHCEEYDSSTILQFLASAVKLGDDGIDAAMRFLSWIISVPPPYEGIRPFHAMGLLLLAAARYIPGQDASYLLAIAEGVLAEEARVGASSNNPSSHWLLGLDKGMRDEPWPLLAGQILADPTKAFPEPAGDVIKWIVELIDVPRRW